MGTNKPIRPETSPDVTRSEVRLGLQELLRSIEAKEDVKVRATTYTHGVNLRLRGAIIAQDIQLADLLVKELSRMETEFGMAIAGFSNEHVGHAATG